MSIFTYGKGATDMSSLPGSLYRICSSTEVRIQRRRI
jgi:hypothetical protein